MEIPEAPASQARHSPTSEASRVRALFRSEALKHYQQRNDTSVIPQFISGGRSAVLWLLAVLLLTGAAGIAYSLRSLWLGH